jgi:hypothetical protein
VDVDLADRARIADPGQPHPRSICVDHGAHHRQACQHRRRVVAVWHVRQLARARRQRRAHERPVGDRLRARHGDDGVDRRVERP